MILQWESSQKPYRLSWVGPNRITTPVSTMEEVQTKIAVIIGPQGAKGEKGERGEIGGLPTILTGGFF
jgi:hypothetical protein